MTNVLIDVCNRTVKITGRCVVSVYGTLYLNTEIGEVIHWVEDMEAPIGEWTIESFKELAIDTALEKAHMHYPNTLIPKIGNHYRGVVKIIDDGYEINI